MISLSSEKAANSALKTGLMWVHVFWAAVSCRWRTIELSHLSAWPQSASQKYENVVPLVGNLTLVDAGHEFMCRNGVFARFPVEIQELDNLSFHHEHCCWPEFVSQVEQRHPFLAQLVVVVAHFVGWGLSLQRLGCCCCCCCLPLCVWRNPFWSSWAWADEGLCDWIWKSLCFTCNKVQGAGFENQSCTPI